VPAGFFVFCGPMWPSNIQRFAYICAHTGFGGQRHAQIRVNEVGIGVSQRQYRAKALSPLGRPGPFPAHTSERRKDLATSLSQSRHRERKLPEPWPYPDVSCHRRRGPEGRPIDRVSNNVMQWRPRSPLTSTRPQPRTLHRHFAIDGAQHHRATVLAFEGRTAAPTMGLAWEPRLHLFRNALGLHFCQQLPPSRESQAHAGETAVRALNDNPNSVTLLNRFIVSVGYSRRNRCRYWKHKRTSLIAPNFARTRLRPRMVAVNAFAGALEFLAHRGPRDLR
jgi:hypothetical protein